MKKRLLILLILTFALTLIFAQNVFAEAVADTSATEGFVCDCPVCNPVETEEEMPPMDFKFDVQSLGDSALIMLKGMFGIAIVTAIIISIVMLLNHVTSDKKDK